MAPRSQLRHLLTFGGQVPSAVGGLVVAMVVATALAALSPALGELLVLAVPPLGAGAPWTLLQAWRLVTWPLPQPVDGLVVVTLLFAGVALVWLGRQLSYAWSERSFLLRCIAITAGAGVVTVLVLLPLGGGAAFAGIWPLVNGLLVTWGLLFPGQRLSWFGAVEMTGATVAKLFLWGTPVYALVVGRATLGGFLAFTPHMAEALMAWLLASGGPKGLWWRLGAGARRRKLEAAKRRFEVVDPGPRPPTWLN